ncbi:putative membrane protein [Herbihabitans rhizosphaerae]|uniref:Putative membrane protein n=1 Tax=Herbihabitans rhizosphaerae TaxID=1872711 RepID=A0A4Q7KD82_9PSEU|nr:anthrone oxygenase family protein [Herbihabitans rhizosphaerae]RZS29529.1 putative membrane protein [Herbihabitans rhizosphaerae]
MDLVRDAVLIAATVTTGLIAGLMFAYAVSFMPGLRGASDRTFVETMQRTNLAIVNPVFLAAFVGAIVLTVGALLLAIPGRGPVLVWTIVALVLYLASIGITGGVNIPLNDELANAGPIDQIGDLRAVRERFENTWIRWHTVRTVTCTGAFVSLVLAVLQRGRT